MSFGTFNIRFFLKVVIWWKVNEPELCTTVLSNYSNSGLGKYLDGVLFHLLVKAIVELNSSEISSILL